MGTLRWLSSFRKRCPSIKDKWVHKGRERKGFQAGVASCAKMKLKTVERFSVPGRVLGDEV